MSRSLIDALRKSVLEHSLAKRLGRAFPDRLRDLRSRWKDDGDRPYCSPVFILASSWRSGSTLLQRMLMGGCPDLLIWGEPFDRSNVVANMRNQLRPFTRDWPPEKYFLHARHDSHHDDWVANLYPEVRHLRQAHTAFFLNLFDIPATANGNNRWGIKEVRLDCDDALYLHWLFPDARFVFLYRDPRAAYTSYRQFQRWYDHWPDTKVITPIQFARHWSRLTKSFLEGSHAFPGVLVRYEDLSSESTLDALERLLGFRPLSPDALRRLDGHATPALPTAVPKRRHRMPPFTLPLEIMLLKSAVRGVARQAGYQY